MLIVNEVSKSGNSETVQTSDVVTGVVTERDLLALAWVYQQGVMTADQIYRAVYAGGSVKSSRHAYKRIQFLQSQDLLSTVVSSHKKHRFLKATKAAQKLLLLKGVIGISRSFNNPSVGEIPHSEVLTDIRIAIKESGKRTDGEDYWQGEGILLEDRDFPKERFRDLMPDALWITKSGTRVAIEFERTRKGITRIRKKVEGLDLELNRSDRVFDRVLWIAVDGAYRDLKSAIGNRDRQTLRTVSEFLEELKGGV